jgi:sec-independent protein translocase protein TatC
MNLKEHFAELRLRIIFSLVFFIISFISCYFYVEEIYGFLLKPFVDSVNSNQVRRLIYTSPSEAFITYLKLSFYSALFFSAPIFFAEFYLFLSPALYKKEKKIVIIVFSSVIFLFLLGAIFAYFFILPLTFKFFASFENNGFIASIKIPLQLETKISEYLNLVIELLFSFGISFQLPILLLFLIRTGFLSTYDLRRKRKYWIVVIFIIAAILTPPDVMSQISLAIPMILLFEFAILIGKNFNLKK